MLDASDTEDWVPLYARTSEAGAVDFTRLYPGVPPWLRESLWLWLEQRICQYQTMGGGRYPIPHPAFIREIERKCRIDTQWSGPGSVGALMDGLSLLRQTLYSHEMAFLSAVDLQLSKVTDGDALSALQQILKDSGSEWRVGKFGSRPGLVKRIDETVQRAAEEIARQGSRPGILLADAWRHAFSMQPDPSAAYRSAVRAVEAAAGPVLTPSDPRPTLGKMITALRDGMQKWQFAFAVDSTINPKQVLLQMMQLLWTNEYSRHVEADPNMPLHVSQEEAESAVVLALALINWFTSGAVAPE